ncbi:patched family protein [Besnoitia besnoiti]|uniref:Patched family protein n=1 Tax=Besnoitia besnoiti TaxID=94643 RepID=A0A2A9M8L0_BESBE|nr:patched family protein [Besnoitia besnoiti]PFH32023.1 patched family protein [Besnoitia besnoiti]
MEKDTVPEATGSASPVLHSSSDQADTCFLAATHPSRRLFRINESVSYLPPTRKPADGDQAQEEETGAVSATEPTAVPDVTSDGDRLENAPEGPEPPREDGLAIPNSAEDGLLEGKRRQRRAWWCLPCSLFENAKNGALRAIMTSFERYAALVYDYPWLFIFLSLLATAGVAVGVFLRTAESDVYTLYSLKTSPSQVAKDHLLDVMPPDRLLYILVTGESNLLTPETLAAVDNLKRGVENLTLRRDAVTTDEFNHKLVGHDKYAFPETVTFQDICAKDGSGECQVQSILDVYPSRESWGVMPVVSVTWPVAMNPVTNKVYRLDALLGRIQTSERPPDPAAGLPAATVVDAAEALLIRMELRGDMLWRPYTAAFEKLILDHLLAVNLGPGLVVTPKAERSSYDELKRVSTLDVADWLRLCAAVLVVFMYTSIVNSSRTYRTKLVPSAMGALASLLGYVGGAGLVYLCGVRHTTPAEATPFLAMGIGVDDLFVIINAYSLTYLHPNPKERVVDAVRDAGLSITITTLTNVITFIIGALSPYYSISMFCIITAGALTWGYVLCLTFFLAGLSLDARREARKDPLAYSLFWRFVPRALYRTRCEPEPVPPTTEESAPQDRDGIEREEAVTADAAPPTHGEDLLTTYQLAALMVLYKKHVRGAELRSRRRLGDGETGAGAGDGEPAAAKVSKPPAESYETMATEDDREGRKGEGAEAEAPRRLSSHIRDMSTQESMMLMKNFERELRNNPDKLLKLYHPEPLGNPGRGSRRFFRDYYGRQVVGAVLPRIWRHVLKSEIATTLTVRAPGGVSGGGHLCGRVGLLGNNFVKAAVLLLFTGLTAAAIYGVTTLKFGLSLRNVTPRSSYLRDFYDLHEDIFPRYGDEVTVFFRAARQKWAVVVNDGMSLFLQKAMPLLESGDREQFLTALRTWLERDPVGQNFRTLFKFSPDNNLIVWQFRYWMPHKDNTTTLYRWLKEGKDIVRTGAPYFHGEVHTALAVIWESDPKILRFTLTNLSIALVCILAVSLLLIPNLLSAIIVVVIVSVVDLWLFGFMALIDLRLSMISMVNLLISIGYSVDFTIHVAHTFTHCVGVSRRDRMVETMIVMGAPVTHGMLSTLLAVVALAGSPKYILEVFFKMMFMVIIFAYSAGMILLPVVLSLMGPRRSHKKNTLKDGKAPSRSTTQLMDRNMSHAPVEGWAEGV